MILSDFIEALKSLPVTTEVEMESMAENGVQIKFKLQEWKPKRGDCVKIIDEKPKKSDPRYSLYGDCMDEYLGEEGVIVQVDGENDIEVEFEDGETYWYVKSWLTLVNVKND